ncbi:peptide synthetase [Metarhizium guizhouense ARSEF 977]|uniref:Peptide synthetase n=1 Tax=Metarhizium guizhouense (strain ARSEF 977) TaxID=1276136 RepID=A0A0B4GBZ8_METGA|nr:peptide synthetase [Metarhizium guizhouense ARSEF 977]
MVKVAWAVLIWHYTASENVSFLSISTADDEEQYYPCTVLVHGDSQICALTMQVMQNVKKNVSTETSTDSTSFASDESPLLNSFTTLKTVNCPTPATENPPDRPVELCITKIGNTLEISIRFRPNALPMQFADRLVATFSHVLTTLAGTPKEDTVSSLALGME